MNGNELKKKKKTSNWPRVRVRDNSDSIKKQIITNKNYQ